MEEERPLFQGMDELERTYAPEQLPPDDSDVARVRADEGGLGDSAFMVAEEPPAAAPVANLGTASAAPPNIGHVDHAGAPGDPETQADYPIGSGDKPVNRE
jgi:hypothetical protein